MYLAQEIKDNRKTYILRESYVKDGVFCSRDLAQLGEEPEKFIVYGSDVSFEIDPGLLHDLVDKGAVFSDGDLEELFFPFLDPYIKYKTESFLNRHQYRRWTRMSDEERKQVLEQTHIFDRRRLHFLRFGTTPAEILDKSPTLYRVLQGKSRDEIEQLIQHQENELKQREYRNYLFSIFDLQRFFSHRLSRYMPFTLEQEKVDQAFIECYCRLDRDEKFWIGYARTARAPEYLLRYLIMYFDLAVEGELLWGGGGRRGGQRYRRAFHPPAASSGMSLQKAAEIFEVDRKQLATMSSKEITALYRKKAHILHPDKGGDHDRFVQLTAAYNELLRTHR